MFVVSQNVTCFGLTAASSMLRVRSFIVRKEIKYCFDIYDAAHEIFIIFHLLIFSIVCDA